jgi:hypothetical protein
MEFGKRSPGGLGCGLEFESSTRLKHKATVNIKVNDDPAGGKCE